MCMMGGGGSAKRAAADQARAEAARQEQVEQGRRQIDANFAGFDDNFYAGRERAFLDNAMPQLDRQFGDARRNLIYALADAGVMRASPAANRLEDLETQYGEGKLRLADEARAFAQQTRAQVADARSGILQNLFAAGDSTMAGTEAANRAQTLAAQPTFSPVAQAFQNAAAGIGAARMGREAAAVRDRVGSTYSSGTGSGKVVRA